MIELTNASQRVQSNWTTSLRKGIPALNDTRNGITSWFHAIDARVTYNVLLGRPWIHSSNAVPSTLHQCLKYCQSGIERMIKADENPFTVEESQFSNAKYFQRKKVTEPQQLEVLETSKTEPLILPRKDDKIKKALQGLTLLLTQLDKVASMLLKGLKPPASGPNIEHGTMGTKSYDLLVKAGHNPEEDKSMGQLQPEVTGDKVHGLNEIQTMLRQKGHTIRSISAGLGYIPKPPLRVLIKRVNNYCTSEVKEMLIKSQREEKQKSVFQRLWANIKSYNSTQRGSIFNRLGKPTPRLI
ncbi:hypothetical protein LIER_09753 [Lithospermum erythrorhizon]|uniref:Uncharacterized protein n=1 Tax=Lithospermum erythrorhizon TaxID=34254 RepID=A0AAV3PKU2_LITER